MMRETEPIMVLRRINMKDAMAAAIAGSLVAPSWPQRRQSVKVDHKTRLQETTTMNNPIDPVYWTRQDGKVLRVFTTGNNLYDGFTMIVSDSNSRGPSTKTPERARGITCVHCRRPISGNFIPSIITHATLNRFEGYDPACRIGCAQTNLDNEMRLHPHNTSLKESQNYLNRFAYVSGLIETGIITPAPDWRLLHSNGGSMSDEVFDKGKSAYIRLPGVYIVPVKMSFVETQTKGSTTQEGPAS